jgi:dTDP-4-dehydrorhamnose reductase
MEVNAIGAENVAAACARLGVALVHYSTDAVFPSACGQTELDVPTQTPSTWYGRSKLLGEQLVQRAHPSAYVLRVANLYGDGGRNWASGLRRTLLADSTDPAKVIADHGRRVAPTWARWVAEVSARLVEQRWSPGVYHVCARGDTTWAGFAKRMAAELGVEHNIRGHLLERRAPLGSEGRLTSLRLLAQQLDVPTWQQLLSRYVREEHDASQGEVPSV